MIEPSEVYSPRNEYTPPERRGVSRKRVIETAKEKVPTIDLADLLAGPGKMRRIGKEWITNCVLPDHGDRVPSFRVNPEKNLWYCHGCVRGGDVVELARLARGYDKSEVAIVAAMLLLEYGHEVPQSPPTRFRKQARQWPVREKIRAARVEVLRRRLFRIALVPLIRAVTLDEREYRAEITQAWTDFRRVPVGMLLDDFDHLGGV